MSFALEVLQSITIFCIVRTASFSLSLFVYNVKKSSINLMTHFSRKRNDSPPFLEYKKVCDLIGKRNAQEK